MVLVLELSETNLVTATVTQNVSSYNYGSLDEPNLVPATAPVSIHPTLTRYSYEKYQRLRCTGAGTLIENMRLWRSGGTLATGESLWINLVEGTRQNDAYATPVNTASSKADQTFPTAIMTIDPNVYTPQVGNIEITPADPYTDYIVWQATILPTSSGTLPGPVPQKIVRVQYDEQ